MPAAVPLQPSCAPATPHTRHVWQPVSPLRRARMGCWARWTQSSARCWARPVSALRALSCTGAAQGSASPRRSAVGSCPPWAGPSPQPRVSFTLLLPMAEAPCIPPGLLWGWSVSQGGSGLGQSGSPHLPQSPAPRHAHCSLHGRHGGAAGPGGDLEQLPQWLLSAPVPSSGHHRPSGTRLPRPPP